MLCIVDDAIGVVTVIPVLGVDVTLLLVVGIVEHAPSMNLKSSIAIPPLKPLPGAPSMVS